MEIGLTYNLREEARAYPGAPPDFAAEFDSEESIGYLVDALTRLGHRVRRIGNLGRLMDFLCAGQGETLDLVFNMAEGVWGRAREAQAPALLEAYRVPYTGADPLTLSLCLDKAMAKRIWQQAGVATAPFAVISEAALVGDLVDHHSLPDFPLFVKPLHEGTSKGIDAASVVASEAALRERIEWTVARYRQPALVEAFLPGREFSVGILGTGAEAHVFGVTEITTPAAHGISDQGEKERWGDSIAGVFTPVTETALRAELADLALRAYRAVACRDLGRVDIRMDAMDAAARPHVMELNPLVGLHPTSSVMPIIAQQAGLSYDELIDAIVTNALRRWKGE